MASWDDKYCDENDDYDTPDDLFDDTTSEDDLPDDGGECFDEKLFRCMARYKGGICCRRVYEHKDDVYEHLWMTHGTSKSLFQVFILSPQTK